MALFGMADRPKIIDDALFKKMPKAIRELNLKARKEARLLQRAQWKAQNQR